MRTDRVTLAYKRSCKPSRAVMSLAVSAFGFFLPLFVLLEVPYHPRRTASNDSLRLPLRDIASKAPLLGWRSQCLGLKIPSNACDQIRTIRNLDYLGTSCAHRNPTFDPVQSVPLVRNDDRSR